MVGIRGSIGLRRIPSSTARTAKAATLDARKQFKMLEKNLQKAIQHVTDVTAPALAEAMKPIFLESQKLVPKDTLRLMKSGFLSSGTFRGQPAVSIGYGVGKSSKYAIFVHEDLSAQHADGTQAKFLEAPYKKQLNQIAGRVSRIIKKKAGV